jgi:hypothetical protein
MAAQRSNEAPSVYLSGKHPDRDLLALGESVIDPLRMRLPPLAVRGGHVVTTAPSYVMRKPGSPETALNQAENS